MSTSKTCGLKRAKTAQVVAEAVTKEQTKTAKAFAEERLQAAEKDILLNHRADKWRLGKSSILST